MNVLKMSCFLEVCMYVNNELYLMTVLSVLQAKFFFFYQITFFLAPYFIQTDKTFTQGIDIHDFNP